MADTVNTTVNNTVPTNEERVQKINDMYDASLNSNKANLEAQYQQSLSNAQADKEAIGTSYEAQRNNLAAEYERQRRNNDLAANVNGLNTGAGSQMDLAQTANYQSNKAALAKAQAQEEATANRNLTDLTTQYQIAVNEAIANNDYQKSAALLDEYNNQKNDMNNQAQILAQYGNFSGYAQLYGQETANQMQKMWALQNPQLAYSQGMITADEYYQMTGKYPNGYSAGGGGGYVYTPNPDPEPEPKVAYNVAQLANARLKGDASVSAINTAISNGGNTAAEKSTLINLNNNTSDSRLTNTSNANIWKYK